MSYYINPQANTKEDYLRKHGVPCSQQEAANGPQDNHWPVCLVFNPAFSAAGICFSQDEYQAFTDPNDKRPKLWFLVHKNKLLEFIPENILSWQKEL